MKIYVKSVNRMHDSRRLGVQPVFVRGVKNNHAEFKDNLYAVLQLWTDSLSSAK